MISLANFSLTQLRCFVAVADCRGFRAAGDSLPLTQSAISQAVAALEQALGLPLLLRRRDGVVPTPAGEAALAEARLVLAAVDRLAALGRHGASLAGQRLRIGAMQSAAARLLPAWLKRYQARHPAVAVTLHEGTDGEVNHWVRAGAVDLGFTSAPDPALATRVVARDQYVVVLPPGHALQQSRTLSLKALHGHKMLMSGGGCEHMIQQLLQRARSQPDVVLMVRDNSSLVQMVCEGLGLTILPELALPAELGGLTTHPLRPALPRDVCMVTVATDAQGPALRAFLQALPAPPRRR